MTYPFPQFHELNLPWLWEHQESRLIYKPIEDELSYLGPAQKVVHLKSYREKYIKAEQLDGLIARKVLRSEEMISWLNREIDRWEQVSAHKKDSVEDVEIKNTDDISFPKEEQYWACSLDKRHQLLKELEKIGFRVIDESSKKLKYRGHAEMSFLVRCLIDSDLVKGIGSQGDFADFVISTFLWKNDLSSVRESLLTTWKTARKPGEEIHLKGSTKRKYLEICKVVDTIKAA